MAEVPDSPSTREALMDAALDHMAERGVLAGLNLREVADAVGVTPANIYHLFGSRQGLLRAALNHQVEQQLATIDVAVQASWVEWRTRIFDLVVETPAFRTTALLALDNDPELEPLFLWDLALENYRRLADEGGLPEDLDVVASHLLTLAMAMGVSIYGEAAARQLGISLEEFHVRTRATFVRLLEGIAVPDETPGGSRSDPEP